MFAFFEGSGGRINPSYWAQKAQAEDIHSPVQEFSRDVFVDHVLEEFWNRRENLVDAAAVWRKIREELLDEYGPSGHEVTAITAAMEFNSGGFEFYDVTDWRLKEYSFHFLYSLHAIVDGIRRYRAHQASVQSEAVAA
jgi:hypothetical protein